MERLEVHTRSGRAQIQEYRQQVSLEDSNVSRQSATQDLDRSHRGIASVAPEATPELRAKLLRRHQLSEGGVRGHNRCGSDSLPQLPLGGPAACSPEVADLRLKRLAIQGMLSGSGAVLVSSAASEMTSTQVTPTTRYRCLSPPQQQQQHQLQLPLSATSVGPPQQQPPQPVVTPRTTSPRNVSPSGGQNLRRSLPQNRVRRSTVACGIDKDPERQQTGQLHKAMSQQGCSVVVAASDIRAGPNHHHQHVSRSQTPVLKRTDGQALQAEPRGIKQQYAAPAPGTHRGAPMVKSHLMHQQVHTAPHSSRAMVRNDGSSTVPPYESTRSLRHDPPSTSRLTDTALWHELERLRKENADLQASKHEECAALLRQNERLAEKAREEIAVKEEGRSALESAEQKIADLEDLVKELEGTVSRQTVDIAMLESMKSDLEASRLRNSELTQDVEELHRERKSEVDALVGKIVRLERELASRAGSEAQQAEVASLNEKATRLEKANMALVQDNLRLSEELEQAQETQTDGVAKQEVSDELEKENDRLRLANSKLVEQLKQLQSTVRIAVEEAPELSLSMPRKQEQATVQRQPTPRQCMAPEESPREGQGDRIAEQLRALLANPTASATQLRQAIESQESLLQEARREVAGKELRERRAALEMLHNAVQQHEEISLTLAIAEGRRVGVDPCDLELAEEKLTDLRSLSEEQKATKAAKERNQQLKERAYLLAKRDDAVSLQDMLAGLERDIRWQDWKDYAGRTLWNVAVELRAKQVQEILAPLLGHPGNAREPPPRYEPPQRKPPAVLSDIPVAMPLSPQTRSPTERVSAAPTLPKLATKAATPSRDTPRTPATPYGRSPSVTPTAANLSPRSMQESELKVKAFRAVVQDDTTCLEAVLSTLSVEVWSAWHNKAGKDLLTLSQERGSSAAYAMLGKALGIIEDMPTDPFREREAVWVFLPGEVQPRRASVMEDSGTEAADVLLEYWDGDGGAERIDRCMVRKMWS
mmetsp:Transcript_27450/g.63458  ORF Transcript_27450/g.63458 Transcript_27450/m.63458 type:complete len:994 (-) Transcript_27450:48-3029(-)